MNIFDLWNAIELIISLIFANVFYGVITKMDFWSIAERCFFQATAVFIAWMRFGVR